MDINIFLMSNKSKLPSRLDLLNNIHQKAKSINEEEATKIMPILSMSKFYNPFLMTVIALPFTILIVAILLVIFGFVFQITYTEWLVCLVLIGLVLMAEFFNTAIEFVVDSASPDIHPLAKLAKDTASAGVLMMAIISAIIGLIIFVPEIIEFMRGIL